MSNRGGCSCVRCYPVGDTAMLDANLITVQWGLIGVFGVVVGLLIEPTNRFLQVFLDSGKDVDRERAALWAYALQSTSFIVLLGLFGLSILGWRDGHIQLSENSTSTWLLLTPVLAQSGFVILVLSLVKRVPPLAIIPVQSPSLRPSPGGKRVPTVIRIRNETSGEMRVSWVDFDGRRNPDVALTIAPGTEETQSTYEGHVFLLTINSIDIGAVSAAATPGVVVVLCDWVRVGNVQ